jgi:hypothetical protein
MKSVNWPKSGYASINLFNNFKYSIQYKFSAEKYDVLYFAVSVGSLSHGQLFHVSVFSIDFIKEKKHYQNIYMQIALSHVMFVTKK